MISKHEMDALNKLRPSVKNAYLVVEEYKQKHGADNKTAMDAVGVNRGIYYLGRKAINDLKKMGQATDPKRKYTKRSKPTMITVPLPDLEQSKLTVFMIQGSASQIKCFIKEMSHS